MKRFLSVFVIVLLSISLICVPAQAEGMSIVATDATTAAGQDFAVDIDIQNNVGIWGTAVDLSFDTEHFSVKEVRNSGAIFANGELMIGPADFSQGFVRVFGSNNALANKTESGTIVSIIFTCHKDAPKNTFEFTLSHRNSDPSNTCNIDDETVSVTLVSATITVTEKANAPLPTTNKGEDLFAEKGDIIAQAVNGTVNSAADDNGVPTQSATASSEGDNGATSGAQSDENDSKSEDDGLVKPYWADIQWSSVAFNLLCALAVIVVITVVAIIIVKRLIKKK